MTGSIRPLSVLVFACFLALMACGVLYADTKSISQPCALLRLDAAGRALQPYDVKVGGKDYNFAQLLALRPADTNGVMVQTVVPFDFKHPGELNDLDELNFIKQKISQRQEPWAGAFLRMKNSIYANPLYLQKMATPPAIISSGFSGHNAIGAFEEMRDANASYTQALMWYFTGDKTYATNAETILETYAGTVKAHEGQNWYLLTSWSGAVFPVAADLLHQTDPTWKNDRVIAKWFNDVYLPVLHDRLAFGNRELAVINAMGAIAVYNGDPAAFYEALNHWVNYVPEYYYLSDDGPAPKVPDYWTGQITPSDDFLNALDNNTMPRDWTPWIASSNENFSIDKRRGKLGDDKTAMTHAVNADDPGIVWAGSPGTYVNGYCAETGRDLGHVDVAFQSTINLAEIAWHQGIDVYSPVAKRLTTFLESQSALRLGQAPPPSVTIPLKAMGVGIPDITAYNHYHNVMGINLPNTLKLRQVLEPAVGKRVLPLVNDSAGHDPANPQLWIYPPPYPSLFASRINGDEAGWVANWELVTHDDLNAK